MNNYQIEKEKRREDFVIIEDRVQSENTFSTLFRIRICIKWLQIR